MEQRQTEKENMGRLRQNINIKEILLFLIISDK